MVKRTTQRTRRTTTRILSVFIEKSKALSPSDVYLSLKGKVLLTSVRRSINTLTKQGVLKQTGNKKKGMFDRPEKTWELWNA